MKELTVVELKNEIKKYGVTMSLSNMKKADLMKMLGDLELAAEQQAQITDQVVPPTAPAPKVISSTKHKEVIDSLMRAISHPVKLGKFSPAQGKYMHDHETQDYDANIFLASDEFLIAGFKSQTYEVSFVCGEDGVHKVIKYNMATDKAEISWEPSMGAYIMPKKYEQVFPVVELETIFGDIYVKGLININVITKNVIEGQATLSMHGKEISVKYTWDKNKYQTPVVYIDNIIAKDGRFKMIIMGLLDAYKAYLKVNKPEDDKPVIKVTDLTTAEAAITTTSAPNKTAKRSQQLFK